MKRFFILVLSCAILMTVTFPLSVGAAEEETYTENGVVYRLKWPKATAVKYTGTASALTIPESVLVSYKVENVAAGFLADNNTVKKLTIAAEKVEKRAFENEKQLEEVYFTKDARTIGERAFSGCTSLKKVVIKAEFPKVILSDDGHLGPEEIEEYLSKVYGVNKIESKAFKNCPKLKYVYYNHGKWYWNKNEVAADAFASNVSIYYNCDEPTVYNSYFEDPVLFNGGDPVYDGKIYKPAVYVQNNHGIILDPSEYTVTYETDCCSLNKWHTILVKSKSEKYTFSDSKSGFSFILDKTNYVTMTADGAGVTISWASVLGATHYGVLLYDEAKKDYLPVRSENNIYWYPEQSYTFTDLTPGKTYKAAIQAFWVKGDSTSEPELEAEFSFTVPKVGKTVEKVLLDNRPTTTKKTTTTTKKTTKKTTTTTATSTATITTTTTTTTSTSITTTATTTATTEQTDTVGRTTAVEDSLSHTGFEQWWLIPVGIVVLAGVVIAIVLVTKKKK